MKTAWAIINPEGEIDLTTIYPHRRGAIVNFLHVNVMPIFGDCTDERIEILWKRHKGDFEVMEVTVQVKLQ